VSVDASGGEGGCSAPGAVIRTSAERPARRPRATQLLFVQTKSNQKIAKTKGFGFLFIFILVCARGWVWGV